MHKYLFVVDIFWIYVQIDSPFLAFRPFSFLVPPTLIFFPSAVRDVAKGETLVASCRAMADPFPLIQWFRGAQLLDDGDPSSVHVSQNRDGLTTISQLTIAGFRSEDVGVYVCVAVNSLGNDSRMFQVNAVGELTTVHCYIPSYLLRSYGPMYRLETY